MSPAPFKNGAGGILHSGDCVTFPLPLITAFIATVDDTLTWSGGRAVERDSET